jgi:hypothetical protein
MAKSAAQKAAEQKAASDRRERKALGATGIRSRKFRLGRTRKRAGMRYDDGRKGSG